MSSVSSALNSRRIPGFPGLLNVFPLVRMLKVMTEQSPDATRDVTQDFLTTGRAGRRNALPDILGDHALVSTSDLPDKLQGLSTRDDAEASSNENQKMQATSDSTPSTSSVKKS